ncbi:MAG TPA: hypothetical protein VHU42_14545 [Rhodopila sp.]|jgi:hypothetical protein|nr:hypothetical protein [Rhodopila sp.]
MDMNRVGHPALPFCLFLPDQSFVAAQSFLAAGSFFADGDAAPPAAGYAAGPVATDSLSVIMGFVKEERRLFSHQYRSL